MRKALVLLLAVLAAPLTAVAATPSHIDAGAIEVDFADLNIENRAGAETLYLRLQNAAERACGVGSHRELGLLSAWTRARACYDETLDSMVLKIGNEHLTRIHENS